MRGVRDGLSRFAVERTPHRGILVSGFGGGIAMIAFACTECGKRLEVKDEHAGKKAKCPSCGAVVAVPQKLRDRDEAGEQIYDDRASLDDLAAAVQRTGRVHTRAQQARRACSKPALAPSVGPAGIGSKRRRKPKRGNMKVGLAILGIVIGSIVGYFAAHHFALWGGFVLIGAPYSPARNSLVPGHVLFFAVVLGAIGFAIGYSLDKRGKGNA